MTDSPALDAVAAQIAAFLADQVALLTSDGDVLVHGQSGATITLPGYRKMVVALGQALLKSGGVLTGPLIVQPSGMPASADYYNALSVLSSDHGPGVPGVFLAKLPGSANAWRLVLADPNGVPSGGVLDIGAGAVRANGSDVLTKAGGQTITGPQTLSFNGLALTITAGGATPAYAAMQLGASTVAGKNAHLVNENGDSVVLYRGTFGGGNAMWTFNLTSTDFYPAVDNASAIGGPAVRPKVVFAVTGSINTSDAREKDWRGPLTDAELRVSKRCAQLIGTYRWKEAVAKKGDGARLHIGVLAQEVRDAFAAEGLDGTEYGLLCFDAWEETPAVPEVPATPEWPAVLDDNGAVVEPYRPAAPAIPGRPAVPAGDRWGVRMDELALFIAAGQEQRIAALEAA